MDYTVAWQQIFAYCNSNAESRLLYTSIAAQRCTLRSVWWRLLLNVLPSTPAQWLESIRSQRSSYEELRRNVSVMPGSAKDSQDLSVNNPLSQDSQSSWNQYFEDSELKRLIRQDVVRTIPEERFFHSTLIQETMVAVLFCYCRQFQDIGFKQGQHELLAPLLLVLHTDHQEHEKARVTGQLEPLVQELMDPAYLEHDAYALLCALMGRVGKFYYSMDEHLPPSLTAKQLQIHQLLSGQPFADSALQSPVSPSEELSPLLARISRIHGVLLPAQLPKLAAHLLHLEIPPQVYTIRWLRLLFGREFALQDLLRLWDAIFWFSTADDLPLIDYLAISLLESVQQQLLASDYVACLNLLMRFPRTCNCDTIMCMASALYTASQRQRQRHRSSGDGEEAPSSEAVLSSLRSAPSSLPPLNLTVNLPASPLEALQNGGSSIVTSKTGGVHRGHSLQGSSRSRSQVTRCASDGGVRSTMQGSRHPSSSPRRLPRHLETQGDLSGDESGFLGLKSSSNNLLNFVKFGSVKFSKPREALTALSDLSTGDVRLLQDLDGSVGSFAALTQEESCRHTCDALQKLSGELSGHVSALNARHRDLQIEGDLSISVAMAGLVAVSRGLQRVADDVEVAFHKRLLLSESRDSARTPNNDSTKLHGENSTRLQSEDSMKLLSENSTRLLSEDSCLRSFNASSTDVSSKPVLSSCRGLVGGPVLSHPLQASPD